MPSKKSEDIVRFKDSFKEQELLKLTNTQLKMEKELSEFTQHRESKVRQSQGLGSKFLNILSFGNRDKAHQHNVEDLKVEPHL